MQINVSLHPNLSYWYCNNKFLIYWVALFSHIILFWVCLEQDPQIHRRIPQWLLFPFHHFTQAGRSTFPFVSRRSSSSFSVSVCYPGELVPADPERVPPPTIIFPPANVFNFFGGGGVCVPNLHVPALLLCASVSEANVMNSERLIRGLQPALLPSQIKFLQQGKKKTHVVIIFCCVFLGFCSLIRA